MYKMEAKQFIVTKRVAKHGKQSIIVVPKLLENDLPPGTIVKITLDILKEAEDGS